MTPAWKAGSATPAVAHGASTPAATSAAAASSWGGGTPAVGGYATPRVGGHAYATPLVRSGADAAAEWDRHDGQSSAARLEPEPVYAPDDAEDTLRNWLQPNLEVRFTSGRHNGRTGFVRKVLDQGDRGEVVCAEESLIAACADLEPVPPTKKDRCMVIGGDHRGQFGTLIGLDVNDAIVKLDTIEDFSLEPFTFLCKVRVE